MTINRRDFVVATAALGSGALAVPRTGQGASADVNPFREVRLGRCGVRASLIGMGTGMHGGAIYLRGQIDQSQVGAEVGFDHLNDQEWELVQGLVAEFFGHTRFREAVLPNPTAVDWPTLVARVESASYMPQAGSPSYAPMLARLRQLFDAAQTAGRVPMDYETRVFFGQPA